MTPRYFDVHSHVTFKEYNQDLEEVLSRMRDEGVWTLAVGVNHATSEEAVRFAETHEGFWATIGLHPNDTPEETFSETKYRGLAERAKVVGVGECGIDYFRIAGDIKQEKKRQWREFEKQMEFAIARNLPLMIHARPSKGTVDTYLDLLTVLESRHREAGERLRGNMHFFVGDVAVARRFYKIGFTTSFTGVLTFAHDYDEVVRFAPLDMLLTETDAPYAAPMPFRGRRNEPSYVKYIVRAIAAIRNAPEEEIRESVLQNAFRLFGIKTQ